MRLIANEPFSDIVEAGRLVRVVITGTGSAIVDLVDDGVIVSHFCINSSATFGPFNCPVCINVSLVSGVVDVDKIKSIRQLMSSYLTGTGATFPSGILNADGTILNGINWSSLTINNFSIGQTTPAPVKTNNLGAVYTDSSGTPGNVTNNSPRGRVAFAAGAQTIVVTSSLVTAGSMINCQLRSTDGALTSVVTAIAAAGSFTITGNGLTTGTAAQVDFLVIN